MTGWRKAALAGLIALAVLLILVSFLPLWWTDRWWVRLWDFPRLQVAGLLLFAGIAFWFVPLGRWRWPLIGGVLAALAWQCTHFVAYLPPYPQQVESAANCPPERQLSLLNANVLMTNREYAQLVRLVEERDPDVLLLLEADHEWESAIASLADRYPYRLSEPLPNTYGLILLSRLPMRGRIRHVLQPGVPSAEVSLTLRDGQEIALHALHPEPPLPGDDSGERDAELVIVGRQVRHEGRAAVVIGDLNDVAWSRTSRLFLEVAGMRDPRVGRGLYPTYNANYPLLRWPLDHLFVSPHFDLIQIDLLPDIGSDHFPIFYRVCLRDDADARRVSPSPPPDAAAEAQEEMREGTSENREEGSAR